MAKNKLPLRWQKLVVILPLCLLPLINLTSTAPALAESDSTNGLKLTPGKVYTYKFETSTVTELAGTSEDTNSVKLQGQVQVSGVAGQPNGFALVVSKVSGETTGGKISDSSLAPLLTNAVSFVYQSGAVKDFYVSDSDPVWSANIKRSLVSLFINHAIGSERTKGFYFEDDVSGSNCPSDYEINGNTYKKERDLNVCSKRDGGYSTQYGVPFYTDPTDVHSDTSIISTQVCEQVYDNSVLKTAYCEETHKVTLLSSDDGTGGAKATVSAKLEFVSTGSGSVDSGANKLSTIVFDHTPNHADESAEVAEQAKILCGQIEDGRLSTDTASTLLTLRHKLSHASEQTLKDTYASLIQTCTETKAHQLFIDAASLAGSSESISFVANLVKEGKLSPHSQRLFRLYSIFANKPDVKALTALESLLQLTEPKYILAASGVARQFCKANPACGEINAYKSIVDNIAAKASRCLSPEENKESVIALQALGNIEKHTEKSIATISNCLKGTNHIVINALQAFRREACLPSLREQAKNMLANKQNSADVRIHAYLAVFRCYDAESSKFVVDLMKKEESLQVLSFIKSHRENEWDNAATNYDKAMEMDSIPDPQVPVTDPRKFSRNFQIDDDEEDLYFISDSNVIYNKESFLPKTLSTNISVQMYGSEYNLFEVGVNLANAEDIFESFFRADESKTFGRPGRSRRAAPAAKINKNDIQRLQSGLENPSIGRVSEPSDVYLRILGTTIYAGTFDVNQVNDPDYSDFADTIQEALRGKEVDLMAPIPLYGDELIIPTASGLPLKIQNEGVATLSLKYKHKLSEDSLEFSPRFVPSTSITNQMRLLVGEGFAPIGFEAETKVAASTDINGKGAFGMNGDAYSYEVKLSLQREKAELVSISNKLSWIDGENKRPMKTGLTDDDECCKELLGLKFCTAVSIPPLSGKSIPSFPLSGNGKISLKMEKTDSKLSEIVIKASYGKDQNGERAVQILFDTPASNQNRKIELNGKVSPVNFYLGLDSPIVKSEVKYSGSGSIASGRSDAVTLSVDGKEYQMKFNTKYVNDKETLNVEIQEQITVPGKETFELVNLKYLRNYGYDGGKEVTKRSAVCELTIKDPLQFFYNGQVKEYIKISGTSDSRLSSGKIQSIKLTDIQLHHRSERILLINGEAQKASSNKLTVDLRGTVKVNGKDEDAKIYGEMEQSEEGNVEIIKFNGKVESTLASFINSKITLERKADKTSYFAYRTLDLNIARDDDGGKIIYAHSIDTRNNKIGVNGNLQVTCKERNLDRKLAVTFNKDSASFQLNTDYNSASGVSVNIDSNVAFDTYLYNINGEVKALSQQVTFSTQRRKDSGKDVFEHSINMEKGFAGKVKTEIYTEANLRNRVTVISSNKLPADYTLKLKYDVDQTTESPALAKGAGTFDATILKGSSEEGSLSLTRKTEPNSVVIDGEWKLHKIRLSVESSNEKLADIIATFKDGNKGVEYGLSTKVDSNILTGSNDKYVNLLFKLVNGPKTFLIDNKNSYKKNGRDFTIRSANKFNFDQATDSEVNVEIQSGPALSRTHSVSLEYKSPTKTYKTKIVSDINFSGTKKLVKLELDLSDIAEGDRLKSLTIEAGFRNFDPSQSQFEFVTIYELVREGKGPVTKSGKTYPLLEFIVKCSGAETKTLSVTYHEGGVYLVEPHQYTLSAEYGAGKLDLKVLGGGDDGPKRLLELKLQKAKDTLKTYSIDVIKDFHYVEGEDPELELALSVATRYGGLTDIEFVETLKVILTKDTGSKSKYEGSRKLLITPNSASYKSALTIKTDSNPIENFSDINVELKRDDPLISGSIDFHHKLLGKILNNPAKADFKFNFEFSKGSKFVTKANFPNYLYEVIELSINKAHPDGSKLKTIDIQGKLDDKSVTVNSKSEYSDTKKFLDVSVGLNQEPLKRLVIDYTNTGSNPSVTATVEYDGKKLSTAGKLDTSPDGFTATFDFDGKWTLVISRRAASTTKTFSLLAENAGTGQKVDLSYRKTKNDKKTRSQVEGKGSIKLDVLKKFITKINVENGIEGGFSLDLDSESYNTEKTEPGQRFELLANVKYDTKNGNIKVFGATSDAKKNAGLQGCVPDGPCGDFSVKMDDAGKGERAYEAALKFGPAEGALKVRLTKPEKTVTFTVVQGGKSSDFGFRTYKKAGTKADLDLTKGDVNGDGTSTRRGFELSFPDRTLATTVTTLLYKDLDAKTVEINLWFDAKNQPEKKLALGFSTIDAHVSEPGQGRDIVLALRHPVLSKELRVKTHHRYGITSKVFELTAELDVFNSVENKVLVSAELTHDVSASTFGIDLSVKSNGQGFLLGTSCPKIKIEDPEFEANCEFTTKSPQQTDRKTTIFVSTTPVSSAFKIERIGGKVFSYKRSINLNKDRVDPFGDSSVKIPTPEINIELLLPGVDTAQIVEIKSTEAPFGYSVESRRGPDANGERTEFWFGRISPVECGFGVNSYSGDSQKKELFEVSFTKHHKQMFVELEWNKDSIREYTEKQLKQQDKRVGKVIQAIEDNLNDADAHVNSIFNSLSNSAVDFTPLLEWYEKNINDISDKYKIPPSKVSLRGFEGDGRVVPLSSKITIFPPILKAITKAIRGAQGISQAAYTSLNNRLDSVSTLGTKPDPEAVKQRVSAVSQTAQKAAAKIRSLVESIKPLKEKYAILNTAGRKLRQYIVGKVQSTYKLTKEDLEQLLPYNNVHGFLEDFQDYIGVALLKPTEITQENKTEIINQFEAAVSEILSKSYSMDFQKGDILVKVPLINEANVVKKWLKTPHHHHAQTGGECYRDMSILPPVGATALIYDNNRIRTFDGKDIDIGATKCQYLLANDISTNNFSVVVQFGRAGENQISILDKKQTLTITKGNLYDTDGKAHSWIGFRNDRSIKGYSVEYDSSNYLIVSSSSGIKVGCTSTMKTCAVQISGYYHGKINGLLGKYNNELYDDMQTDTPRSEAEKWKVNTVCQESYASSDNANSYPNLDYDYFFTSSKSSPHKSFKEL